MPVTQIAQRTPLDRFQRAVRYVMKLIRFRRRWNGLSAQLLQSTFCKDLFKGCQRIKGKLVRVDSLKDGDFSGEGWFAEEEEEEETT